MSWYLGAWKKFATFSGRARRSEYWFFILFHMIAFFVLGFADGIIGTYDPQTGWGVLSGLYGLAALIPSLALLVRRLHDTGRSGITVLIGLIPIVGSIILLVFLVSDSKPEENQFGPSPKAVAA